MASRKVKGVYVNGWNHSGDRPKFYESLGLWRGSINIQLPPQTDGSLILPGRRVEGLDPVDMNQYFLIRPCKLRDSSGFQILPVDKNTDEPKGHYAEKVIEISLREKIEIKPNEELEVELQDFED